MRIDELKDKVEKYRESLAKKSGGMVMFSETGPASMGLIDAIVQTLDAQERRIAALEAQLPARQ